MSQKHNFILPQKWSAPVRPVAISLLTFAFTSPLLGQGVCDDPVCGVEASCGTEVSCGCEVACTHEPVCGCEVKDHASPDCGCESPCSCEPACGLEPACGCETPCSCEPACGLEPDCGCHVQSTIEHGCEKGLLTKCLIPKSGPVFHVLDKVAGGLEKLSTTRLVSHRMLSSTSSAKACGCSHCQPHPSSANEPIIRHHDSIQFAPPISHDYQSVSPLTNPPAVVSPGDPKTTIRRDAPMPIPRPAPLKDDRRPGNTFDRLTDPFQDDSVHNTANREPSIRRTTYATASNSMATKGNASLSDRSVLKAGNDTHRSDVDEFADYFRAE